MCSKMYVGILYDYMTNFLTFCFILFDTRSICDVIKWGRGDMKMLLQKYVVPSFMPVWTIVNMV